MNLSSDIRKRIAICIGTRYRNVETDRAVAVRSKLARTLLEKTVALGYTTIVVDDQSDALFLDNCGTPILGKTVFHTQLGTGLSNGRQEGFRLAANIPDLAAVITTEPEKTDMAHKDLYAALAEPILNGDADIAMLKRTDASFCSMSPYQRKSEKTANRIINDLLRLHGLRCPPADDLDVFCGPKAFSPAALPIFMREWKFTKNQDNAMHTLIDPSAYANALFFPVYQALKDGMRVVSVPADLRYSGEQTEIERNDHQFMMKRDRQRGQILIETIEFLRKLSEGHVRFKLVVRKQQT